MPHSVSRTTRKRRHKKIRKLASGFWGRRKNYRQARVAVERAWRYAWFHRALRKRDFRRLWITRINAAARLNGMSYGTFMHGMKLAGLELDRKVLADIAVRDPETFSRFADAAREASAAAASSGVTAS